MFKMISQIKNYKIFIIAVAIFLALLVQGLFVSSSPKIEAAVCYTDLGGLNVQPETHSCPTSGSSVIYRDTSGNIIQNAQSLPNNRCFASRPAAGPSGQRNYDEYKCDSLENLRIKTITERCEDSGGRVVLGEGVAGVTCVGAESTAPSDSSEPSIEDDCTDPTGINQGNCGIVRYLVLLINVLSGLVGIVVIASIIYGGIQYSSAGSDAQRVSAAKDRIRNAIIALVFFLFMYALLNYLVPGGVIQ